MSAELELFFKKNHKNTENVKLAVTSELCDKDGKPLEWEIRKLNTREVQALTKECVTTKQIGKKLVPSTMDKVKEMREYFHSIGKDDLLIEVDGNITIENARKLYERGADIFVAGSSSLFHKGETAVTDVIKKKRLAIGWKEEDLP